MSFLSLRQNVLFQIISWTLAANLYVIARFVGLEDYDNFNLLAPMRYGVIFTQATLGAIGVGLLLGIIDTLNDRRQLRKRAFSFLILTKGGIYFAVIIIVLVIVRATTDLTVDKMNGRETLRDLLIFFTQPFLLSMLVYAAFVSFFINFVKQVSQKFGPGITLPMFLGKYYKPKQEERIFMFLDLRDSTTYAEKLGDLKYSELMQDCFYDLATQIEKHDAEIYQYVGDEAVLNWKIKKGIHDANALRIYFAFEQRLKSRSVYYHNKYGLQPVFKAGVHGGSVIVTEIGQIKKDIAYHGDVLNTTDRIQSQCNVFGKTLLISETLLHQLDHSILQQHHFMVTAIGSIDLKGKQLPVTIFSVEVGI